MQSHTGPTATAASGPVLPGIDAASGGALPVDLRRFAWIKPLAVDYALEFPKLAEFFAGNPADAGAWRDAIARASAHPRDRRHLVEVLKAQQDRREAPEPSRAAAARLADSQAVAILTGQQAGLFGGPLFTLLKAVTALQLAERVRTEFHVPATAVFWVDAEDHDWDEVRVCNVLDQEESSRAVSIGDMPGAREGPVARVQLNDTIAGALAELESLLPATEFTPTLLEDLRAIYRAGAGMAEAFSRWLERVLGPRGLVVFDASDPAAKPLVASVFMREIDTGMTARLASDAGAALVQRGYHAQVTVAADSLALFHLNSGREPITVVGDGFQIAGTPHSRAALLDRAKTHPEEFSPNVLLRPVVQDALFPTACYVAGPSELAYLAQLRAVYGTFAIPMPLVYPRATATLVDSSAMRFMTRGDVAIEALRARDEAALNELLLAQLPPSVEASLQAASTAIEQRMDALAREIPKIDATLEGAARSVLGRMQDDLKKLHAKIIHAAKRKDDTLRRQFRHAQSLAFPNGHPQEREIGFVWFLNKYGPVLIDRLFQTISPELGKHWVITI